MTPSRLIAFLAALVLSLAGGSDAAAKSARREILAALESASSEWARASAERVREKLASEAKPASGPRDYPYAQVVEEYTSTPTTPKTLAATFTFANELVSQTRYVNGVPTTKFLQVDGFGSTRWLTSNTGAITDTIDYDAFGNEVSRTGTTAIEHLYRGEAFDPSVGFYYLRARWMDPSLGRFTQQDKYMGIDTDSASLHRYFYAENDPIGSSDPSGYMATSTVEVGMAGKLAGLMSSMAVPTLGASAGALAYSRGYNIVQSRAAARACAATFAAGLRTFRKGDCADVRMPIVLMSEAFMPGIGEHVFKSQAMGRPAILNRSSATRISNRINALGKCASGFDLQVMRPGPSCDEYPFASTYQGGWNATVAKVQRPSNWIQGGVLSAFYTQCVVLPDIVPLNEFLVLPVAASTVGNYQCRL